MAGETILIVDDNETNLRLLRMLLLRRGYDVHTAAGGEEARARVRAVRPAMVLMDLQLPEVDGLQLTREIKADPELRETIVVAVTSYAMKGDREKALAAGCDGYVTKPIDTRALPQEIAQRLEKRAAHAG
ncbi:MAG TPA: response regulator [Myxococcales bacterium]|nr:response regulator [Myxococcales bacterium]